LPTDPLPAFTFPPLEEESKKLTAEVQKAVAARSPTAPLPNVSSSPSVDALLADLPPAAKPSATPQSSSPSVDALLANLPTAGAPPPSSVSADHSSVAWVSFKSPLRRIPSNVLLALAIVLVVAVFLTLLLFALGPE
jgi:hypothetical protein